jgi:hypothetical protein
VLGGYDSSRCLTDPIVSSLDTVQLQSIALNVSSGGYAYLNTSSAYIPDLLRANGSAANNISVHPRPGVPHLYLPQDTCDAIASHLPVTYSPEFNLYLWDTEKQHEAYNDIVSSPHHLSFTFSSEDGKQSTISVPFAHLNLTMQTLDARHDGLHSRQRIPAIRFPRPELADKQALPRPGSRARLPKRQHPEDRIHRHDADPCKEPAELGRLVVQHS